MAANALAQHLKITLDRYQMEKLIGSVARQWQQNEGHACLFIDGHHQLVLTVTENDDGGCRVTNVTQNIDIEPLLTSLGLLPEIISGVIARINLGQEVEFQDMKGVQSVLWYDPKSKRFLVRPSDSIRKPKFDLGEIDIQKEAAVALAQAQQKASHFLQRHASGEWGDISDKAMAENDHRLKTKQDVISVYHTNLGVQLLVCTTGDRKRTILYIPRKNLFGNFLKDNYSP